jgi:predicted dehydrogenase
MTYPNGLAISEGSWTQVGYFHTYTPVIYGTEGALMIEPREGGKLWKADKKNPMGKEVKVGRPATHLRSASANFIHCLQTGEEFFELGNDRLCRDTQEILEAGLVSIEEGAEVSLPLSAM